MQVSRRYAKHFDRRAVPRKFPVGSKVLLLLPVKDNKLEMAWQGPYELNGQTVHLMLERPTEFLFEANGGLTLRSASLAHSGNYSLAVVVMVKTTGNIETMKYERSANLTVAEPPGTNGILQATQDRKAIYDNHTSMWHVTLSCGQFVSLGHPAIDVVWQ
ncbi:hypothetical protein BaRGS_00034676, partial [Batillaria attramentaria]